MRDLQRIIDAVLDGVVVVDEAGRFEFLNAEASRLLEVSVESAGGAPVARVLGPDHVVTRVAEGVLRSGRSIIETERRIQRRFAADVVADVAASPIHGEREPCDGVVIALRDRTIQQTLQQFVDERERLDAFGRIAAGIAHEVKNPLGGIRGAAELVARRSSDDRTRDAAELIVREVDRIAALVDDLMVFTQGESVQLQPTNIHRVLDDVIDLLSMDPLAAGVQLVRAFDPSIPELMADRGRLIQVFLNLARNALQALEGKGTLRFETRMTLEHRLTGERGESLPTVSVTVEDDGPGIPAELLDKVTTPLFTTRADGTGLGLSVARHWVAMHGGVLRIDSRPGSGTRVRVSLPLRREKNAEEAA